MDVFSWCLRPLLRQGYLQPPGQDAGADRVSAFGACVLSRYSAAKNPPDAGDPLLQPLVASQV